MAERDSFTTVADGDQLNEGYYNGIRTAFNASVSPVGSVTGWLKSLTNTPALPDGWVECNGQTISDADSVYNGVTIPDLNGGNRFLRGDATSGSTGGSATHNHKWADDSGAVSGNPLTVDGTTGTVETNASYNSSGVLVGLAEDGTTQRLSGDYYTNNTSTLPPYYTIVWIMRIK